MKGITKIIGGLAIGTVNSARSRRRDDCCADARKKRNGAKQGAGKRGGTHYAADRGERGIYLHRKVTFGDAPLSPARGL